MKLVIVESPAKCATIKRYLGDQYDVQASYGHIRDLSTSGKGGLGVNIEAGFIPTYIVSKEKIDVVKKLQDVAKQAEEVILATDPDREGEAIAWHLANVLGLDINTTKRLEFHEITRVSITEALENPRKIDLNLVSSQETRRILDRIIGFKLSTLMYQKIKSRSAGRVQSATLKMIADHDDEIKQFVPKEYYSFSTNITLNKKDISLTILDANDKPIEINTEAEAKKIIESIPEHIEVIDVHKQDSFKDSKEPFTTSTLQQEAFNRLKFKTSKTQFVAQELYEGIDVGDEHMGLITYMRTDSNRLSPVFIDRARAYIKETYGEEYLDSLGKTKKVNLAQDAHEGIRPTSNHRTPDSVRKYLTPDQYHLYKLIYERTIASLMKPKHDEKLVVTLKGGDLKFRFELTRTIFQGYEIVTKEEKEGVFVTKFPEINLGDSFEIVSKMYEQKFTTAPAHYSEAKVVKMMEEVGIGRPSTYASTIDILRKRKYVTDAGGIMTATDQGIKTAKVLEKYFPEIVDLKYTASIEDKLDSVQEGNESRIEMLSDFYYPFIKQVEEASTLIYKDAAEETGELCPKCGSPLVYKQGKNGKFVGCSNYPKCKFVLKEAKKEAVLTGELCPKCGSPLVERVDKTGKKFIACSSFPKCRYTKSELDKTEYTETDYVKTCPECGGHLVRKKGKYGDFLGCTNFPTCNHMEKISKKLK